LGECCIAIVVVLTLIVAANGFLTADAGESAYRVQGAGGGSASHDAVVVMKDGTEVSGTIIQEDDTHISLRTVFGVSKIPREKIKEIRGGGGAIKGQFEERFKKSAAAKDVAALLELAEWARRQNLTVECERSLRKVLEIDGSNESARNSLGYARLDGKWLEPREVQEKLASGYELVGLDLFSSTRRSKTSPSRPVRTPAGFSSLGAETFMCWNSPRIPGSVAARKSFCVPPMTARKPRSAGNRRADFASRPPNRSGPARPTRSARAPSKFEPTRRWYWWEMSSCAERFARTGGAPGSRMRYPPGSELRRRVGAEQLPDRAGARS
jgi:hypothetical protein